MEQLMIRKRWLMSFAVEFLLRFCVIVIPIFTGFYAFSLSSFLGSIGLQVIFALCTYYFAYIKRGTTLLLFWMTFVPIVRVINIFDEYKTYGFLSSSLIGWLFSLWILAYFLFYCYKLYLLNSVYNNNLMEERNWILKTIKTFKSFDVITKCYLIVGALAFFLIANNTYGLSEFVLLGFIVSLMLSAPFVIKKCIYILVYTITKAIEDAKIKSSGPK